jgi:GAF domain-containing protein
MTIIVNPLLDVDDRCLDELADEVRMRAVGKVLAERGERVDPALQDYVALVADLLRAPVCVVDLVLDSTVLVVASHGVGGWLAEAGGMPVEWAACSVVVQRRADVLITDTHHDPRHTGNPIVAVSGVRSYAGVPLRSAEGHIVGTLCVLHTMPNAFATTDLHKLAALGTRAELLLRAP